MNRATCFFIFTILIAFLGGCKAHGVRPAQRFYVSEGVQARLLPTGAFRGEQTIVQEIRTFYGGADRALTGIVKLSSQAMQVIILVDMTRLMTVDYGPAGIKYEFSPLIPASAIEPEYVLFDIQLAYFPADAINRGLPDGMSFSEEGDVRVLYHGEKKIVEITQQGDTLEFVNHEHSYSYKIKHLEN
jgi:hypothetical protein